MVRFKKISFSTQFYAGVLLTLLHPSSTASLPPVVLDPASCPSNFKEYPLILVSMDGFRADYIGRGYTPTLEALSNLGVKAPFIKPSYPSITFPNHYTIATGLLPPYHGIIANRFFDPEFNRTFRVGSKEFFEKRFWGGEPIWQTVERQGKIAATYFWPGSEVVGQQATYWLPYNETHPFKSRVDTVLSWLDLPEDKRPSLITLYMHEPDEQGHQFGPDSFHVNEELQRLDAIIQYLLEGLHERHLTSCVDLIILADHGMAEAGKERLIDLRKFIPDIDLQTRFWNGVFPRFEPLDGSEDKMEAMLAELACKRPQFRVYRKTHVPVRWHLGAQRRIEDIVIDLDPGIQIDFDGKYKPDQGDHGYDNIFHVMNAFFLAHGPSFRRGIEVESFQNVEIYNLICALLDVNPAPNNGTWGSLHHLLNQPPPIPDIKRINLPEKATLPKNPVILEERLSEALCINENVQLEKSLPLLWNVEDSSQELMKIHVPWGISHSSSHSSSNITLLLHYDHVTGFSERLKMSLWTSFYLHDAEGSKPTDWFDDARISVRNLNQPCNDEHLEEDVLWEPLFHPEFSYKKWLKEFPFLTTNAIPLTKFLRKRWRKLRNLIRRWSDEYEGINVVMGTVFDYNEDTLVDDISTLRLTKDSVYTPTHLFAVITRCFGEDLSSCSPQLLDVAAFIFPQSLVVENCMTFEDFAREFSAKVDDVEKITGLQFFSSLSSEDSIRLRTRFHSNLWDFESWENRLRSDLFGLRRR